MVDVHEQITLVQNEALDNKGRKSTDTLAQHEALTIKEKIA